MPVSTGEPRDSLPVRPAAPSDRFGRYVLIERFGDGAMGVVWRARDNELGRDVALKLVRHHDATSRERCAREARAMAAVSHRNVVPIYDVVCEGSTVAIAMRLCKRGSLRDELQTGPWRRRLGRLLAAARGLQAVHAADLVHRDFKPENVMLDDDGTPMVGDFGLVLEPEQRGPDTPGPESSRSGSFGSPRLTATGTVMGTPAYLAPELFRGCAATAKSDQFAMCVALFEALFEQRPFVGTSWEELAQNVGLGRFARPQRRGVPAPILRAVYRGLAADPSRRWPSVAALVATLESAARPRRVVLTAIQAGATFAVVAALAHAIDPGEPACDDTAAIWTEARRDTAAAAFRASGRAHADETWQRVAETLDRYAADLAVGTGETCVAWHDGHVDARSFEGQRECLRDRGRRLAGTIAVMEQADTTIVDHAIDAVRGLPPIEDCVRAPLAAASPSPELLAAGPLRMHHAHAKALQEAGKYEDAAIETDALLELSRALGDARMRAEALWLRGEIAESLGEASVAERNLVEAVHLADGIGHWKVSLGAASLLVFVVGHAESRFEDAQRWARHARALIDREDPGGIDDAALENNLSALSYDRAQYEDARVHARRSLELYRALFGEDDGRLASAYNALGNAEQGQGDLEAAREAYARGHALDLRTYGPDHPNVATILSNLGANAYMREDAVAARDHFARVLGIRERTLGADNARLADTLTNLGAAEFVLGEHDTAFSHLHRALEIRERTLPEDHPLLAGTIMNVGHAHAGLGHYAQARPLLERALALLERALGPDHPHAATAAANLAAVAKAEGRLDEAERLWTRAAAVLEPLGDPLGTESRVAVAELARARAEHP